MPADFNLLAPPIPLQVKKLSLAIISFAVGHLLLSFLSVFRMSDNVAAGIISESNAPVEAIASHVRTTGDVATWVLSAFLTIHIKL